MKIAIITGATSGIGYACVEKFLSQNYLVVGIGRNKKKIDELKQKSKNILKGKFVGMRCDFLKKRDLSNLLLNLNNFKKIDTLINCAGVAFKNKIDKITINEWEKTMYLNITIPFLIIKKLKNKLKLSSNASIINVSSIAGRSRSISLGCHYTTSKSALIGLTRHLGSELGNHGIRVNCITPSQTKTPMLTKSLSIKGQKDLIKKIPLRRLSEAKEQSDVIYFLASEEASYINGAILDVNGGQL